MKSVENTSIIHINMAQKAPSVTSGRSSKHRRKSRKKKANQWTLYIETLKSTIDRLYEMCRIEYSVSGCKEALLYLQNGTHDFLSLIEAIRLEESFNEENRPQSLAWEIRKSTSSPIQQNNGVQLVMNSLPSFAQVVMSNMRNAAHGDNCDESGGWQLVQRRRRSISSTCTSVTSDTADILIPEVLPTNAACTDPSCGRPLSVYERLSGSQHRCHKQHPDTVAPNRPGSAAAIRQSNIALSKARNPKSVMDIPQTKSSMAKISYCRQRIWENEVQPSLAEKLRAKQRREKSNRSMSSGSSSVSRSPLKNEINLPVTAKPAPPLTYSMIARKKPALDPSRSLQCINEIVESTENEAPLTSTSLVIKNTGRQDTRSEPAPLLSPTTWGELELGGDVDWREMTEEEQSLAMEEESIKMEIEKMESELESLDAEISRQRSVDVEIVKSSHKESTTCENICFYPVYKEGRDKLQEEFKKFCQESWSEMVEREFAGKIHTPGQVVDKLERIASPSRRRCEKDEENLSKKYEDKLRKAEETRLKLQQDKVSKLKDLSQKREEVHSKRIALGDKIREHIRIRMENNMERAKENRDRNLTEIVRKAKEDEQKVLEVQFINSCVDTNMRQDILDRNIQVEERKQSMADERARKFEEKAAREQAVEQRRKKAQNRKLLEKENQKESKPVPINKATVQVEAIVKQPEPIKEPLVAAPLPYTPVVRSEPAFPTWAALADPSNWPTDERKEFRCTICDVKLLSQLEGMAHVVEMDHLNRAGVTISNVSSEVMDKQLDLLVEVIPLNTQSKDPEQKTSPAYAYRTMEEIVTGFDLSVIRFEKRQVKDSEAFGHGIRDRCKPLAKLLHLNWKNKPSSDVRKFERILIDLLKSFESDKDGPRLFGDSMAVDAATVNQMLEILANWDASSLPHRVLHKLMLLCTKMTASPKFLLLCIMSKKLLYIADSTTDLAVNQGSSIDSTERLCSLLDLFTNLVYRAFYDSLGIDGQPVVWGVSQLEFWELINHILSVLAPIGAALTPLIRQRENTELHEKATRFAKALACRVSFADLNVMASFFLPFSEKLLIEAMDHMRPAVPTGDRGAGSPRRTSAEKGETFPTTALNLIYSLQIKEALWKKLMNVPLLGFRLYLVMSEAIRSCPVVLTESTFMNELHNLIYLAACFAARNTGTQILCQLGGPHSILSTISSLPQSFFVHKAWSQTVIAALISITHNSPTSAELMTLKCLPIYLYNLLKKAKNIKELGDELSYFVPREQWDELLDFYHSSMSQHNKTIIS